MTREEAKKWLNKLFARADITDEYGDMEDMQPYEEAVNMGIKALEQEPKTGHWIDTDEWRETVDGFEQWGYFRKCSKCGYVFKFLEIDNYCPNCGCAMVEPQESEGEQPKIIKCPNCGNVQFADKEWCPDCGAKMVEPQERSEE